MEEIKTLEEDYHYKIGKAQGRVLRVKKEIDDVKIMIKEFKLHPNLVNGKNLPVTLTMLENYLWKLSVRYAKLKIILEQLLDLFEDEGLTKLID